MKVIQVTPDKLAAAWPHAAPWLARAQLRGHGQYPLEDMEHDLREGKKLLFKVVEGAAFGWLVLGCMANSRHRTALVHACGGRGVLGMLPDIVRFCEAYALTNGCRYIMCSGRAGWTRALARFGWNEMNRTCGKEL